MKVLSLIAAGSVGSVSLLGFSSPAHSFNVVNPADSYAGKSQFEWAKDWWKAVLDAPSAGNPLDAASPGSSLNLINAPSSPVHFLTGTGSGAPTTRSVAVTRNKAIFFPIFTSFAVEPDRLNFSPADLCAETSFFINPDAQTLFASVDSGSGPVNIGSSTNLTSNYQQGCRKNLAESVDPIFTTNDPVPPVTSYLQQFITDFAIPPYITTDLDNPWDTVMDGYWVMLEPLAPGDYTIRFGMTPDDPSQYSQDNTWRVTVLPVPAPGPLPALGAAAAFGWSRRLRRRVKSSMGVAKEE